MIAPRRARPLVVAALLLLVPALLFAQPIPTEEEGAAPPDDRLQLAIANADYPVTPGDVYQLTFLQGVEQVTTQVVVESTYRLNLGIFGEVNARGMTFAELKPEVEQIIAEAYPRGLPSLNIASIGLFQVTLAGAIPRTRRITAWGLSRLTDLIGGSTGAFTSLREVEVRSTSGRTRTYDVFRAIHTGDESQDPLLRPGDTVAFRRRGMTVTVEGQVYQPDTYELLAGEGLADLEEFFQGFRPRADTRRLVVERQAGDVVRQISIGSPAQARGFDFREGDVLIVPARAVPRPVVYLEGAVDLDFQVEPQEDTDSTLPVYNRVSVPLTAGDTLYSLLIDAQDRVSPFADIERGYIVRQDAEFPIRVDMRQVLYRESEYTDFELEPFDRIVIPLDQPFVVVSGGVTSPGRYPYNPFESYAYYLGLAGIGSDSLAEVSDVVQIFDRDGNPVPTESTILPGYTISVAEIEPEDEIVVVSGAVPAPGTYPYDADGDVPYYTRLAGLGGNALADAREAIEIYDAQGNRADAAAAIEPGFTVYVSPLSAQSEIAPVLVRGAVAAPGLYEIVRDATASYYIQQAGGIDDEVSADGSFTVHSAAGEPRPADAVIEAGDTIEVERNGFVYNFNRYFPVITTGLTFITTIITIVNALNP